MYESAMKGSLRLNWIIYTSNNLPGAFVQPRKKEEQEQEDDNDDDDEQQEEDYKINVTGRCSEVFRIQGNIAPGANVWTLRSTKIKSRRRCVVEAVQCKW